MQADPRPIFMDRALQAVHSAVDHVTDALAWLEELTGLPPLVLFTALALLVGAYYLISGIVAPSQIGSLEAADEAATSQDQVREMTIEQLGDYDGSDPNKPLFMAIQGRVYDVSSAKDFYGPGGPYSVFVGKDASRALAKMSFQAGDLTGDLEGLTDQELEVLKEWEVKLDSKYPKVGVVVLSKPGLTQSYAQVSGTRGAEHKVEEEAPMQTYATTREAEHKVEEEPPKQTYAATREAEHKMEEEAPKPTYAQVAATGEAEHKVEEERPKQDREVKASGKEHGDADDGESVKQSKAGEPEQVTDGQAEAELRKDDGEPANTHKVGGSEDGEGRATAESGSVVEHSSESASESKPDTKKGDQSSSITRDVPVSAGDKAESNESSVVTRDIPVSGEHEVDQPKQQQGEAEAADAMTKQQNEHEVDQPKQQQGEAEAEDAMTKQQNEVDENKGTRGQQNGVDENKTLEQVLDPSKEQYVISKHGGKQSQDEKDFELVDKGKIPDAESLLSIRDSDYIRGLQDVSGL